MADNKKDTKKSKSNKKKTSKEKQFDKDYKLLKQEIKKLEQSSKKKVDIKFSTKKSNNSSKNSGNKNSSNSNKSGDSNKKKPSKASVIIGIIIVCLVVFFIGKQIIGAAESALVDELSTSDFISAVESNRVKNVVYDAGSYNVSGTYTPDKSDSSNMVDSYNGAINAQNEAITSAATEANKEDANKVQTTEIDSKAGVSERSYKSIFVGQDSLLQLMQKHPDVQYEIVLPSGWTDILISLLPIVVVGLLLFFFFNQMTKFNSQQMGFGKTKAKKSTEERPDVKFKDVAGVDEAVEEMAEVKDFLSNPKKYQKMGAKIPRGCLLVGPPGTGKTLLARAVAGEAGVPFFNISGSDFVEMFVGVGASRVRDLFGQAKEAAPSIIFIDEIDAVGRHRGAGLGGGHDEREQTLNQMLVEMDGFDQNDSVVLIAATNRADILDPALLRPGRFDRQIVVDVPDVKGREQILKVHSKNKPLLKSVDLHRIAQITPGFTGADLANLMNESALLAARKNKTKISQIEISESMERVIAGPERKSRVMDDETKQTIAFHESGHALIGHTLPKADPVHKISIISRGRALGYTLSIPKEDKVLNSLGEMMDELAVFMGGRVAEEIFCNDITTGASNDLERATKMARAIVTQFGMSKKLGTQVFGQPNHEVFLGKDYGNTQDYSEKTAQEIDAEVARIMKEAHDTAYKILDANKDQMKLMASVLLERETVEGKACDALLEGRWQEYLATEKEEEKASKTKGSKSKSSKTTTSKPASAKHVAKPTDTNPAAKPAVKTAAKPTDTNPAAKPSENPAPKPSDNPPEDK